MAQFKENQKTGFILFALLAGYAILSLMGILSQNASITGLAISNQSTQQDASLALAKTKEIIDSVEKSGLNAIRLKDLLQEARYDMGLGDYGRVIEISNEVADLRQKAFEVQDKIKNTTTRISNVKKSGLDTGEAQALLNLSIAEFGLENYESAEELIQRSSDKLDIFVKEELNMVIEVLNGLKNISLQNNLNISRLQNTINEAQDASKSPELRRISIFKREFAHLNNSIYDLIDANNEIKAMAESGFGVARVNNVLNEAKFALELGYYDKIEGVTNNIKELRSKAFAVSDNIKKTRTKIDEAKSYGLNTNESESLFNLGENEFKLENYEEADKLLKQSFEDADRLLADYLLFGVPKKEFLQSINDFLKKFWWMVLIILATVILLLVIAFRKLSLMLLEISLKNLGREKEAIVSLIKKAQTAYFKDRSMDKSTYDLTIEKYQDRIIQLKEKIPVINEKIARKREKALKLSKLKYRILSKKNK